MAKRIGQLMAADRAKDELEYAKLERGWRKGIISNDGYKRLAGLIGTEYWARAITNIARGRKE